MPRFRPHLQAIPPYSSAREEFSGTARLYLDANENPYAKAWEPTAYRYPDPYHTALREAIAAHWGISPAEVACGAGSDELIDWILRAVAEPSQDTLLTVTPSYGVYTTYARIHGLGVREVRLEPDFSLPTASLLAAAGPDTPLAILCRPNNPTGTLWPAEAIEAFVQRFEGWVVLDEAYIEFSSEPRGWLDRRTPQFILLRTFSKAWGMAGWRVGYMIANPEVVSLYYRTKLPYNLSQPAQARALSVLKRWPLVEQSIRRLQAERARLVEALAALPGVQVFPSEANFLLVRVPNALAVYRRLLDQGIVVRYRGNLPLCENTLRITLGRPEENNTLLEALCRIISS